MEKQYYYPANRDAEVCGIRRTKKRRSGVGVGALIASTLIAALLGGAVGGYFVTKFAETQAVKAGVESQAALPVQTEADAALAASPASFPGAEQSAPASLSKAQIIEYAAPSVAGLDTTYSQVGYSWFGQARSYETEGSGSGIIVSSDGYIVTCNHVVEDAQTIQVVLNDDTVHDAVLVGTDTRNDLAVIKIDASGLKSVTLGDSDMLTVGEDVIAIGNPLGELRGTATSGIISALDRSVTIDGSALTLLQTDAAISPGNSGGGLFNSAGTLIGIVNAKASSDNSEGLGFAIPVNSVKDIIADLMDLGYVRGRAYLGVSTQNVTMQQDFGGWGYFGGSVNCVEISKVIKGSAADKAGLLVGDLLLSVDGTEISSNSDLSDVIDAYNAGDTANITIQRGNAKSSLTVAFDEYAPEA